MSVTTTTTTVTTPTGITGNTRGTTAATTTTQPVRYRIPPNLSCKKNDRIINGVEAIENSWPWIVRMSFGAFMCGGTILSENLIVTAAHCCASASNRPDRIKAFIGDHDRKVSTASDHLVPLLSLRTTLGSVCTKRWKWLETWKDLWRSQGSKKLLQKKYWFILHSIEEIFKMIFVWLEQRKWY